MHLAVETILSFFDKVINEVVSMDNELIVIGGDWNVALNPKIDSNQPSSVYRARSRKKIIDFMNSYELVDVYRTLHKDTRKYSWRRFNSTQRSRLDYLLVSELLGLDITSRLVLILCLDIFLIIHLFVLVLKLVLLKGNAPCGNLTIHFFET